jgi:hypothetical protein
MSKSSCESKSRTSRAEEPSIETDSRAITKPDVRDLLICGTSPSSNNSSTKKGLVHSGRHRSMSGPHSRSVMIIAITIAGIVAMKGKAQGENLA